MGILGQDTRESYFSKPTQSHFGSHSGVQQGAMGLLGQDTSELYFFETNKKPFWKPFWGPAGRDGYIRSGHERIVLLRAGPSAT